MPRRAPPEPSPATLIEHLRAGAHPLTGATQDYDPLLETIGDAQLVLLGEATHGTHEFYQERARITQRLIREKGFTAVAVEADWPAAYRVNRHVRGAGGDATAVEALADFKRFPAWLWRNAEVVDFIGWLRAENDRRPDDDKAGFYGLDLYSLHESMEAVLAYLARVDPDAALSARQRYACFDRFPEDPHDYGYAAGRDLSSACEQAVVAQLVELRKRASDYAGRDGPMARDDYFWAEQNARTARSAEQYYRTMYRGDVASWNVRDRHMAETLDALARHLGAGGEGAKIVVWAHNSHLGDARATQMGQRGELNLGQLARERHDGAAVLVGFTTNGGTVTAASNWGEQAERKHVRPGLPGSWEDVLHEVGLPRFMLLPRRDIAIARALGGSALQRAIGVIYRPEAERLSHYVKARPGLQFDALLHFDETRALEPLELSADWERGELPVTYPRAV